MHAAPLHLLAASLTLSALSTGCSVSSLGTARAPLGQHASADALERVATPAGVVRFHAIESSKWAVSRAGLINLQHERAAHLEDGLEPIVISVYVIEHPTRGRYLIDSGVASSFHDPETAPVSGLVASEMNFDKLRIGRDTASVLAELGPVDGVFLTHMHLDHIMGLPDVPIEVPVFTGPGEAGATSFLNLFVRGSTDDLLGRERTIYEWDVVPDPSGRFEGVVDVFGDGSVYAIHTPGHTPGSMSFLIRTREGTHLVVGDASHTEWGWTNCVEPGEFSSDIPESVVSLKRLRALADTHTDVAVHLGHQHHDHGAPMRSCGGR